MTTTYYAVAGKRVAASINGVFDYFGYDALGSQVLVLNNSGNVVGSQLYGPYGNQRYSFGTLPTSIGFTGQQADSVTGLDYYNARYYDPVSGQFLSADVVQGNAAGMNPYSYVAGNPETKTDPTGQKITCGPESCGGGSTPPPTGDGGTCTTHPTTTKGCPGYVPTCADTGPKSNNGCKYGSGECKGHTYNQCTSWKSDAKAARDKAPGGLKNQYTWEGIVAGVGGIILGLFQFQKGKGLLERLKGTLTVITAANYRERSAIY